MSKNVIKINAGKVKMTKYDPITGGLSTNPKDIRVCTETVQEIQKRKAVNTYELPDGNSDYPMGIYENGVTYDVSFIFSDMSNETLAFLHNVDVDIAEGSMKDIMVTSVPLTAPYEIPLLGVLADDCVPVVVDVNNEKWEKESTVGDKAFKIEEGTEGKPDKLVFDEENAGTSLHIEYDYVADSIESYAEKSVALLPAVLIEIVHDTLSSDKTRKYRNNTVLKKMQYTGSFDETFKREHSPETLPFTAVRPDGEDVAVNKKVEVKDYSLVDDGGGTP